MATNFYMKKASGSEIDIESNFNIHVTEVRGLNPPNPKKIFTRDWAAENGIDYYIGTSRKVKSSEVTIQFYAEDGVTTAIQRYRAFCDWLLSEVVPIQYRDTLQNNQVNLIYNTNRPAWYQLFTSTNKKLHAEITFINPTGAVTHVS